MPRNRSPRTLRTERLRPSGRHTMRPSIERTVIDSRRAAPSSRDRDGTLNIRALDLEILGGEIGGREHVGRPPTLTTVNVTGLPAFNVTCAGVNAYSLISMRTTEAASD